MSVNEEDFPGCCTALVLTDFGNSHTSEYGFHDYGYQRIRDEVIEQVEDAKRDMGIITAILTSEQTKARAVLKELGFIGTGDAEKGRHHEVTIELYYLHCKDWKAPEKAVEPPRPRDAQGRFLPAQQQAVNPFVAQPEVKWKAQPYQGSAQYVSTFRPVTGLVKFSHDIHELFTEESKARLTQLRLDNNLRGLFWVRA